MYVYQCPKGSTGSLHEVITYLTIPTAFFKKKKMIIALVTKSRFRFITLIKLAVSIETFTKRKRYLF